MTKSKRFAITRVFAMCYRSHSHSQVVPSQLLSWSAMVLVVAFSSSLDVAAIEMEIAKPLDYDKELTTVGLSNTFRSIHLIPLVPYTTSVSMPVDAEFGGALWTPRDS